MLIQDKTQRSDAELVQGAGSTSRTVTEITPTRGLRMLDVRELWRYRSFLYILVWRDLKVRYKQTVVGVAWALFQPLVLTLVFSIFLGYLIRVPSNDLPYPVFVLAGLIPWTFFSRVAMDGSQSLVSNRDIITKLYFPRFTLPLASLFVGLADFGIALLVLFGLALYYGVFSAQTLMALPLFVAYVALCGFAVGVFGAALNAMYRDIGLGLPLLIQIWMFCSPVIYPSSLVPESVRWIYSLNPMTGAIEGLRWSLTGAESGLSTVGLFVMPVAISVVMLLAGVLFFVRAERGLVDRI